MSHDGNIPSLASRAPVATNARHMLAGLIAEFFRYAPVIADPTAVTELHRARIAARRLRYTLETFDTVFGDEGAHLIAEITGLQDILGETHDLDVRINLIEDERRARAEHGNVDRDLDRSLASLLERERSNRARLHDRVVAEWKLLREHDLRKRLVRLSALPVTAHDRDDGVRRLNERQHGNEETQ